MGQALMVQGTSSSVGKSALITALCRIFYQDGYKVAPFKAQNMGSRTVLTKKGETISPVQYCQAVAAGVTPQVAMNPILLKPISDVESEVFVMGKSIGIMSAQEYIKYKPSLIQVVKESISSLKLDYDLVAIEGAGSPAEANLREHDLVNMTVAKLAQAPVLLVADIDLGGVFAYVHGTLKLLLPHERARIKGIVVNKFRGDPSHFKEGVQILRDLTGLPIVGVIPFFGGCPEEDLDLWANHVRANLALPLIRQIVGLKEGL